MAVVLRESRLDVAIFPLPLLRLGWLQSEGDRVAIAVRVSSLDQPPDFENSYRFS